MMVSAMNKDHADELEALVRSERFFGGKYAHKTIKIYSAQKASELDEAIAQLLEVEKSDNPIEIVIQVMMLKE
jgi:type III restriction enzyme